jgi:tRNA threonylcarbamoyladenosine biosynthesis protein TsaE
MKVVYCRDQNNLGYIGREILTSFPGERIFAFYGNMGAGKTTFIKAMCRELGVSDMVNSPTFALIHEYRSDAGLRIYHFDFYRISSIREVYDFGYEDYFFGGAYCMLEWPEKVQELLPASHVYIHLEELAGGERKITYERRTTGLS